MPTILVSGFDAWGDLEENPAWLAVEAAKPALPTGWDLHKVRLPVSWERAAEDLLAEWTDEVAVVLAFGVAPIKGIALEQIAINLSEGADVDGCPPPSKQVIPDGPAAYWSTLPLDVLQDAVQAAGLPVSKSAHAGTYLCNHLFYHIIHHVLWASPDAPAGFIHLPNLKGGGSLEQPDLNRTVEVVMESIASSLTQTGHGAA